MLFLIAATLLGGESWKPIDLDKLFKGTKACFILKDEQNGKELRYHAELCTERLSPCSTFKILNSMIALETGVLNDDSTVILWDGTRHPEFPAWDHDQTLRTAIRDSVVWFYQEAAKRVGAKRMQFWLDKTGYGNRDISGGQTRFWLSSSLKVSANEQVSLLERLERNSLPFSARTMRIVRDITIRDFGTGWILHGKTGSSGAGLGWYVGFVERGPRRFTFAANVRGSKDINGPNVRTRVKSILSELGLISQ